MRDLWRAVVCGAAVCLLAPGALGQEKKTWEMRVPPKTTPAPLVLEPAEIQLGDMRPGEKYPASVVIRNTGEEICLEGSPLFVFFLGSQHFLDWAIIPIWKGHGCKTSNLVSHNIGKWSRIFWIQGSTFGVCLPTLERMPFCLSTITRQEMIATL